MAPTILTTATMKYALALLCALLATATVSAQEKYDLQACIEYARANNFGVQRAEIAVKRAQLNERQTRLDRLPNLSGNTNAGFNFGRSIDPTTNTFSTQRSSFQSYGVNAGVTLYNAGFLKNSIAQSGFDLKAASADARQTQNDLALNVAQAYLQVLFSREQINVARQQVTLTQTQLDRTDKLITAGQVPRNDRLDLVARLAQDRQQLIVAENNLQINLINLRQLMQLPVDRELEIVVPEVVLPTEDPDDIVYQQVYAKALNTQPRVLAAEYRLESAAYGDELARANMFPRLSLFAGLNTNYSSLAGDFIPVGIQVNDPVPVQATIGGVTQDILLASTSPASFDFDRFPYLTQLENNFGYNVGLSLQVPIYSNGRNRTNIELARLNEAQAQFGILEAKQQIQTEILRAIADARAAKQQYEASQASVAALQLALDNTERRLQLGAANTIDYTLAREQLTQAQAELVRAKYDFVFRMKVIDFYEGKTLTIR